MRCPAPALFCACSFLCLPFSVPALFGAYPGQMVYLDHAATTDLRPESRQAWLNAAQIAGNPSSLHQHGRAARRLVEESRERAAAALGVPPSTLVFTSGGTESDNLAIVGAVATRRGQSIGRPLVVLPPSEHKAVLEPVGALADAGVVDVEWLGVAGDGRPTVAGLQDLLASARDRFVLVCAMAVNNETGAVAPLADIAAVCADAMSRGDNIEIALHTDAVQALGVVPLNLSAVTTAAFSAHKVGGPMGVGLLYVDPASRIEPLARGGGHEHGLRAGTPDVPGIAAAAVAVELAVREATEHQRLMAALRDRLLTGLAGLGLDHRVNSPDTGVPGVVNIAFPGCESDALMMLLDAAGIAVSTGSACTVGIPQPSHVLTAMGRSPAEARSALRISFGRSSRAADVDAVLTSLPQAVTRARRAGVLTSGRPA